MINSVFRYVNRFLKSKDQSSASLKTNTVFYLSKGLCPLARIITDEYNILWVV